MTAQTPIFRTYFARTSEDLLAAQRLRHRVFVKELGASCEDTASTEQDIFDPHASHLLLSDERRPKGDQIVGVYRLMSEKQAFAAGGFSSAAEYDLSPLLQSKRRLLELGRSCVHEDYRGGMAMYHLWSALAALIEDTNVEILFGVASFHGTKPETYAQPLSLLHSEHLAPEDIRPLSLDPTAFTPAESKKVDRKDAMAKMPALIKAYLRIGGVIGQGAFVDRAFNTTDVCMIVDVATLSASQKALYEKKRR